LSSSPPGRRGGLGAHALTPPDRPAAYQILYDFVANFEERGAPSIYKEQR